MNLEGWLTFIGILLTFLLGALNFYNGSIRGKSIGMLERGQYLESVNKSVELANDRALKAEQRASDAEERANKLEDRIIALERKLSYRITFDVLLGSNPSIAQADIRHYPDRRVFNMEYEGKDRRKK